MVWDVLKQRRPTGTATCREEDEEEGVRQARVLVQAGKLRRDASAGLDEPAERASGRRTARLLTADRNMADRYYNVLYSVESRDSINWKQAGRCGEEDNLSLFQLGRYKISPELPQTLFPQCRPVRCSASGVLGGSFEIGNERPTTLAIIISIFSHDLGIEYDCRPPCRTEVNVSGI